VAGSCEYGDEPVGPGITDLAKNTHEVIITGSRYNTRYVFTLVHYSQSTAEVSMCRMSRVFMKGGPGMVVA
jgi:hypothetical protein